MLDEVEATSAPILPLSQRCLVEHKDRVLQFIKQQLNNAELQTPINGNDIMSYMVLFLLIPAAQINPQLLSMITVTSQEGKDMLQLLQNIL